MNVRTPCDYFAARPMHARRVQRISVLLSSLALLSVGVVSGCAGVSASPPSVTDATNTAPPLPVKGATVYRVVRADSQVRLLVYRTGPLAAVGHNHVISTSDIHGRVYLQHNLLRSGFALRIPLKSFVVDSRVQRAQEGAAFGGEPDAAARAGTRAHMLGPAVLDAAKFPDMRLRSLGMVGPPWYPRVKVRVTLHGVTHDFVVPTALFHAPHGRLIATGGLTIRQTDFGIKPFSIFDGALSVRNRVHVSLHLVLVPIGK